MLHLKRWLVTIFIIVFVIAGLGFIKFTQIKAAIAFGESFPETSETVEATTTRLTSYQPTVSIVGEIKPLQVVKVRNEVAGMLTKVRFTSGSKVEKGDVLAQFNIDTETAQYDAIKAEIKLAELDVQRFTDLLDVRASSKEQLDRAKAQLAVAQAQAKGIQASIDKKTLYAPISGSTSIHDWQVGTFVAANSSIVTIVGNTQTLYVDFKLPQIYANIPVGTQVVLSAQSLQENTDTPGVTAEITALNQQFDESSRTLLARATLNNVAQQFTPGAAVNVNVPTGQAQSVIPLPNQAIRYDTFGAFVYSLEKDDNGDYRAKRVPVEIESKLNNTSFVSSGLSENQLVATTGSAKLLPNMLTYIATQESQQ
ncbi:MAG: efflux RND transporter periplasmic adaptor subunit [Glaciecola sp.]